VTDDPIRTLERELLAAARRAAEAPARTAGAAGHTRRERRPLRRAAAAAAVLVPVLVVLSVALTVHSHSDGSHSPGARSPVEVPPRAVLGVLRRPGAAPHGQALSAVERVARTVRDPTVTLQRASLRQIAVTVAPDSTVPLDLAVVRAADGRQLIGLTVPAHSASGRGASQTLYLYADQTDQAYSTVAQLRASGIETWLGQDRNGTEDYAVVVPDGVNRVRLNAPGDPIASVHDNVAGFRLSDVSVTSLSKQLGMTWLDAAGRMVHRVAGARLPGPEQLHAQVNAAIRTLRAHLAVLRRRPTASDRAQQAALRDAAPPGDTLIADSARVARATPASGPIVIALVRETADGSAGVLFQDAHGGGCCTAPSDLLNFGAISSESGQGGASEALVLVPDGVRALALHLRGRTIRANVVGNVAVLSGSGQPDLSTSMTWYGANGQVVRRVPARR
jgi:catechol 2,3-dioxygenase-like lactoylglutathione lyase family enzyme